MEYAPKPTPTVTPKTELADVVQYLQDEYETIGRAVSERQAGALVKKAADQVTADYTTATAVAWTGEEYEIGGVWHDNATNNSRLTVPSGYRRVRVTAQIGISAHTADTWVAVEIRKNGAAFMGGPAQKTEVGATDGFVNLVSPPLEVSPGDYFETFLQTESDNSITVTAARSWMAIEAIE